MSQFTRFVSVFSLMFTFTLALSAQPPKDPPVKDGPPAAKKDAPAAKKKVTEDDIKSALEKIPEALKKVSEAKTALEEAKTTLKAAKADKKATKEDIKSSTEAVKTAETSLKEVTTEYNTILAGVQFKSVACGKGAGHTWSAGTLAGDKWIVCSYPTVWTLPDGTTAFVITVTEQKPSAFYLNGIKAAQADITFTEGDGTTTQIDPLQDGSKVFVVGPGTAGTYVGRVRPATKVVELKTEK